MSVRTWIWINSIALLFAIGMGPSAQIFGYLLTLTIFVVSLVQDGAIRDMESRARRIRVELNRVRALLLSISLARAISIASKEADATKDKPDA